MKKTEVKSINALMKHLRKNAVHITGSKGKNDLRNIGYYHGYKGYRFYNEAANKIPYTDFVQVKVIYEFDMKLKAWFYPLIMTIETALKNRVLECTLKSSGSADFVDVFAKALNAYKDSPKGSGDYKDKLKNKHSLREKIYEVIANNISSSAIVQHFYYNDQPVPLWAIFELITLGEFGNFYRALNKDIKLEICDCLQIDRGYNTSGEMLTHIIFALRSLRNAIAHNKPIFDVRFKEQKSPLTFFHYLSKELGLPKVNPYYGHTTEIKFEQLIDYCLLVVFLLKRLGVSKTELMQHVKSFESLYGSLKAKVPGNIYATLVPISIDNKIEFLKTWIKR